jgi:hypothetical protein
VQQTGEPATNAATYAAWAGRVEELCMLVDALRPLTTALGMPDPTPMDWHGALFGKLRGDDLSKSRLLGLQFSAGTQGPRPQKERGRSRSVLSDLATPANRGAGIRSV